jgi:hypothetical protein
MISSLKHQPHYILGAEHCFSKLRSLKYSAYEGSQKELLKELTRTCKSIQQLKLVVFQDDSEVRQVSKLIEAQENLNDVDITCEFYEMDKISHFKIIEESLIKHVHTVQHLKINWLPITKILSYDCKNLLSLDIEVEVYDSKFNINWSHLENLSLLPVIKSLRVRDIPPKISISLIENAKGHLTELNIYIVEDKIPIQVIYKNCPNLKYLKLDVSESNLLEFKKLLIECQYLEGLMISLKSYDWDNLFEILANFSPTSLFKFEFFLSYYHLKLEFLKSFLDNWENRHPMLLQFTKPPENHSALDELLEKYKKKGIIKKYFCGEFLGDFCWDY